MTGYAMRRDRWMEIEEEFPEMSLEIKKHLVERYDSDIRLPMLKHKALDF